MSDTPSDSNTVPTWRALLNLVGQYWLLMVILVAHVPMLLNHFESMWRRPQHQYFPLVIIAVIVLLVARLQRLTFENENRLRLWLSNSLLAISVLIFAASVTLVFSPWLAAVSFVLSCGSAFLVLQDRYAVQNLFGIWLLLCLLVPPPQSQEEQLSSTLKHATTVVSGKVLELFDVPNLVEGATLIIPGRQLFVEEVCAGSISMMSVVTCCMLLAVWANHAWLNGILLILSSLILISVTNVFRIVIAVLVDGRYSLDLLSGWNHSLLEGTFVAGALLLMLSTDQLLRFFLDPVETDGTVVRETPSLWLRFYNRFVQIGAAQDLLGVDFRKRFRIRPVIRPTLVVSAALFACLGMVSVYAISAHRVEISKMRQQFSTQSLGSDSLPAKIGQWRQVGYHSKRENYLFPQESKLWSYQNKDTVVVFALDYTFDHWHCLDECYESLGWKSSNKPLLREPSVDKESYLRCQFRKGDSHYGMLTYAMVDLAGEPFDPPQKVASAEIARRCFREGSERLLQIQGWTTSLKPILGEQRRSIEKLYEDLRSELVNNF
ncbi:exosortase U [Rubripirellula sp.]|nr:exosortase U [Rubripirellula sp.]